MIVTLAHTSDMKEWWLYVQPLLQPAIDLTNGRYDAESVFKILCAGKGQLWVCWDKGLQAAGVTQLTRYPSGKLYLSILFLGGSNYRSWLDELADNLEWYATKNNAAAVEIQGRKGWLRLLKARGFTANGTVLQEHQF